MKELHIFETCIKQQASMIQKKHFRREGAGIWLWLLVWLLVSACGGSRKSAESIPPVPDSVNHQAVLAALDEAIEYNGSAGNYYQRARVRLSTKALPQALSDIERAIEKDNSQPKYYLLRAEIRATARQTDLALADAEQAKTLQLQNPELYTLLGELYFQKKQLSAATQHLDKALDLAPFNAQAWFWKGKTALAAFDTTHALTFFQTTLQHQPAYTEAYAQLSLIYNGLYDFTKAREYVLAGLKQHPDNPRLHYQLAETCRLTVRNLSQISRIDSAKTHYLFAAAHDPALFKGYYETGVLCFLQKDYPNALSYFEKVKDKRRELPFGYEELLATCYDFTGAWEQALNQYAIVVSQDILNRNPKALERYQQIKNYLAAQKYRVYLDSMARLYPELYAPKPRPEPILKLEPLKPKALQIK